MKGLEFQDEFGKKYKQTHREWINNREFRTKVVKLLTKRLSKNAMLSQFEALSEVINPESLFYDAKYVGLLENILSLDLHIPDSDAHCIVALFPHLMKDKEVSESLHHGHEFMSFSDAYELQTALKNRAYLTKHEDLYKPIMEGQIIGAREIITQIDKDIAPKRYINQLVPGSYVKWRSKRPKDRQRHITGIIVATRQMNITKDNDHFNKGQYVIIAVQAHYGIESFAIYADSTNGNEITEFAHVQEVKQVWHGLKSFGSPNEQKRIKYAVNLYYAGKNDRLEEYKRMKNPKQFANL
jgi:hypothetical protein